MLHPALAWSHYRSLLCASREEGRAFCEIEAIRPSPRDSDIQSDRLLRRSPQPVQSLHLNGATVIQSFLNKTFVADIISSPKWNASLRSSAFPSKPLVSGETMKPHIKEFRSFIDATGASRNAELKMAS
jgi:hypothetical protein